MNEHDIDQASARLERVKALLAEAKAAGAEHDECLYQVDCLHKSVVRALAEAEAADKSAKEWLAKAREHRARMDECIAKSTALQADVSKALGKEVVDG